MSFEALTCSPSTCPVSVSKPGLPQVQRKQPHSTSSASSPRLSPSPWGLCAPWGSRRLLGEAARSFHQVQWIQCQLSPRHLFCCQPKAECYIKALAGPSIQSQHKPVQIFTFV